ncbi:MAG TPA: AsmA-like C-terminal region-containing protein [Chitinophagales bacterium]|nr:AsmA-like C-terminal region-containing protein [Chitinophagales bacterium]
MKKVFIAIGLIFVLLIGAVLAVPFLFKDKINAAVKEAINENVNAKVDYGDFSLSLIRSFPNFNFSINDVSVVGVDAFKNDTLTHIKNLNLTVDLMSVINGSKYKLLKLELNEPLVNAIVNFDGKANWDIAKSKEEKKADSETKFSAELKNISIKNGNVTYNDKKGGTFAAIKNLNFTGSGDVTQNIYLLKTLTDIEQLSVRSGAISYLSKAKLNAKVDMEIDNLNSKYTFKENEVTINALGLAFGGFVQTKKNIVTDLTFKAKESTFKNVLSMIPAVFMKDFDKIKTDGKFSFNGFVKGTYKDENYPAFGINLQVTNAMFQYPSLPTAVKNIQIAMKADKPQGNLNATVIDISKFHVEVGAEPVDGKVLVKTPISDPNVQAKIKGKINLANVPKFYPIEGLKKIDGLLLLDLDFSGKQSDFEAKRYENVKAAGNAKITNLVYDAASTPLPLKVSDMAMTFNPRNVTLTNLNANIGRSDFQANGTLDNFMAYAFGKGDLNGNLNLKSNVFDANQFLTPNDGSKKTADTAKAEFFKVPKAIDFTANSQFGKIFYDKLELSNVKGNVTLKDEAINLNELFANLLGGSATISARYNTKNLNSPDVTFSYDIKNFDIQQTYKLVDMASKMAPIIQHIQGSYSSDLKGSGKLNPDMSVDLSSLKGDGKVEIPSARIVGLPILQKVAEVAKIQALTNPELKNAWTVLKFKDGKVAVEPATVKLGNYTLAFEGKNGFDQSIDYDLRFDVPQSELGNAASLAQNMIPKIPGIPFKMPETVSFFLKATGTASKPQIKLTKVGVGGGKSIGEDLKQQVTETVKEKVDEVKQQAQQELEKQKQALEQKAREEADRIKNETQKKAQQEADRLKKEAEKKAKEIFKSPW